MDTELDVGGHVGKHRQTISAAWRQRAFAWQWSHRIPSGSSSGWRHPRQLTFFFANRMMPALAIDGVEIAIDRVCSPAGEARSASVPGLAC